MLSVSQKLRYGLAALYELALRYHDGPVQIREIAGAHDVPQPYLEQLMGTLKRSGLHAVPRPGLSRKMLPSKARVSRIEPEHHTLRRAARAGAPAGPRAGAASRRRPRHGGRQRGPCRPLDGAPLAARPGLLHALEGDLEVRVARGGQGRQLGAGLQIGGEASAESSARAAPPPARGRSQTSALLRDAHGRWIAGSLRGRSFDALA